MSLRMPRGAVVPAAVLLGLVSIGFSVRAALMDPPAAKPAALGGAFGAAGAPRARILIARLARGLIAHQRADGSFDSQKPGEEFNYEPERVASSALATAALAEARRLGLGAEVAGLDAAIGRGLGFVKARQSPTGAIGREVKDDFWSHVDATTAAILAFALVDRPADRDAMSAAAAAQVRFVGAGLRNGWTRSLHCMTLERLSSMERAEVYGSNPRALLKWREVKQRPGADGWQATDWNIAEAIARVVMGLRKGVDPFPRQLALACLEEPPIWSGPSTDCQSWWMAAWLVGRSGEGAAWFATLLDTLEEEAIDERDLVPGGFYAHPISQGASAIFALSEGLSAQVVSG